MSVTTAAEATVAALMMMMMISSRLCARVLESIMEMSRYGNASPWRYASGTICLLRDISVDAIRIFGSYDTNVFRRGPIAVLEH